MENLTSAISVQVDTRDKELANDILKNLGLNMSTFVNMAIKQLLYTNGLPFEVKNKVNYTNIEKENNKIEDKLIKHDESYYENMPNLIEFIK